MHNVDSGLHLLLDDEEVAESHNLVRVLSRPEKLGPLLGPDKPWEAQAVHAWGTVLRRPGDGRFQMWYAAGGGGFDGPPTVLCHAQSSDGLTWEKPQLGIYRFGPDDTNVVQMVEGDVSHIYGGPSRAGFIEKFGGRFLGKGEPVASYVTNFDSANVVLDPKAQSEEERYKLLMCIWRRGATRHEHAVYTSPDGLHWRVPPEKAIEGLNDASTLRWDPLNERWLLGCLKGTVNRNGHRVRTPHLAASTDLKHWSLPWKPFELDQEDDWGSRMQGHFLNCFAYGNQMVGIYSAVHSLEGWCQAYLLSSRDGTVWHRVLRDQPWIACGTEGSFDEDQIDMAVNEPIIAGEDMLLYYTGRRASAEAKVGKIGAARVKRDRFAGLNNGSAFAYGAGKSGSIQGEMVTSPVPVTAPRLAINARTYYGYGLEDGGTVRISLLGEDGKEIRGFGLEEADRFRGDAVDHTVSWKGTTDLSALVGREVRLRILINRSTLYAYRFQKGC